METFHRGKLSYYKTIRIKKNRLTENNALYCVYFQGNYAKTQVIEWEVVSSAAMPMVPIPFLAMCILQLPPILEFYIFKY